MGFLTGKTAIITGGGRAVLSDGSCGSIGYGIATAYAKEGANLVITGRNVKKLEDAKEENTTRYNVVMDSVNLEEVRDRAINDLGMGYATSDQIIEYQNPVNDYVKQYESIPKSGVLGQTTDK